MLGELENSGGEMSPRAFRDNEEPVQLTMDNTGSQVLQRLRELDVNAMTPMQCMNALFELNSMLKD